MPTFARLNQRNKTSAAQDIEIRGFGARSATRSSSRSIVSLRLRERLTLFRNVEKIESLVETGGRKLHE